MTSTTDLVKQLKRSSQSKAILVPLIEQFMKKQLEIEDDLDREFLNNLIEARSQPRKKGVYSPSMLSSCVRQVYFVKTGVKKKPVERIEMSGYFHDGNWRHFKWQFAMWKMHRAGIIQLIDCGSICLGSEVWVSNDRGDFGGTIDNIIYIPSKDFLCTVDWKGMGGNPFNKYVAFGPPLQYIVQSVGYAGLANSDLRDALPRKIQDILIIGENKNGPVFNRRVKSPLGLYEWRIPLIEHKEKVSTRIKLLRKFERLEKTPPPECKSTRTRMFKDCPFSNICRGEIEIIERKTLRANRITKDKKKKQKPVISLTQTRKIQL